MEQHQNLSPGPATPVYACDRSLTSLGSEGTSVNRRGLATCLSRLLEGPDGCCSPGLSSQTERTSPTSPPGSPESGSLVTNRSPFGEQGRWFKSREQGPRNVACLPPTPTQENRGRALECSLFLCDGSLLYSVFPGHKGIPGVPWGPRAQRPGPQWDALLSLVMKGTDESRCSSFEEADTKGLGASGNTSEAFAAEIKAAAKFIIGNPFITLIIPLEDQSRASQEAFNILHYGRGRLRAACGEHGPRQLYMAPQAGGGHALLGPVGLDHDLLRWESEQNGAHLQAALWAVPPLWSDVQLKRKITPVMQANRENNRWEICAKWDFFLKTFFFLCGPYLKSSICCNIVSVLCSGFGGMRHVRS